jgi:hypothetical protein
MIVVFISIPSIWGKRGAVFPLVNKLRTLDWSVISNMLNEFELNWA